jgi:hypothetical protein
MKPSASATATAARLRFKTNCFVTNSSAPNPAFLSGFEEKYFKIDLGD